MSRQKAQGTRHESWLVRCLRAAGLPARRLAEGGSADEGDVETTIAGRRWVLEAKATQVLNVQLVLGKARRKAAAAAGSPVPVALAWKRLVPVEGKLRRQPVGGEAVVVVLGWEDFIALVSAAAGPAGADGAGQDTPDLKETG